MKKPHSWWRRRGDFLYFAVQTVNLVVLEEVLTCSCSHHGMSTTYSADSARCETAWKLFIVVKVLLFLVWKKNAKAVTVHRRGGWTFPRKESVDFGGGCCGPPGTVCVVLLGRGSILSRSLRPLLCSRQVSEGKKSSSASVSGHSPLEAKHWNNVIATLLTVAGVRWELRRGRDGRGARGRRCDSVFCAPVQTVPLRTCLYHHILYFTSCHPEWWHHSLRLGNKSGQKYVDSKPGVDQYGFFQGQ